MSLFCYFFSFLKIKRCSFFIRLSLYLELVGMKPSKNFEEVDAFNTNDIPNQAKIKLNNLKILLNVIFMLTAAFVIFLQFSIIKVTKFIWEFLRFLRFNFMIEKRVDSILLGVARIKRASSKRVTFIIPFELNR